MTPADDRSAVPVTTQEADLAKDSILGDRFMLRFSEDTLQAAAAVDPPDHRVPRHLHPGDRRGRVGRHQSLRRAPAPSAARPR